MISLLLLRLCLPTSISTTSMIILIAVTIIMMIIIVCHINPPCWMILASRPPGPRHSSKSPLCDAPRASDHPVDQKLLGAQ